MDYYKKVFHFTPAVILVSRNWCESALVVEATSARLWWGFGKIRLWLTKCHGHGTLLSLSNDTPGSSRGGKEFLNL